MNKTLLCTPRQQELPTNLGKKRIQFLSRKGWILGFASFSEFLWFIKYKSCFACTRPISSTTKKSGCSDKYFCHNRYLKLSYFHDFDASNPLFHVYFGYYFIHNSFKNDRTVPFMDSKWPQSQHISNEPHMNIVISILMLKSTKTRFSAINPCKARGKTPYLRPRGGHCDPPLMDFFRNFFVRGYFLTPFCVNKVGWTF